MILTKEASAKLKASTGIQLMPGLSISGSGQIASPSMIYGGGGGYCRTSRSAGIRIWCPASRQPF